MKLIITLYRKFMSLFANKDTKTVQKPKEIADNGPFMEFANE